MLKYSKKNIWKCCSKRRTAYKAKNSTSNNKKETQKIKQAVIQPYIQKRSITCKEKIFNIVYKDEVEQIKQSIIQNYIQWETQQLDNLKYKKVLKEKSNLEKN